MNARSGWNAAQRAAERELKKPRTMHGPVGPTGATESMLLTCGSSATCRRCGFNVHAPTCPTQRRPMVLTQPYRNVQITGLTAPEPKRELTLAEAELACREGKVVRKTRESYGDRPDHEVLFRWFQGGFEQKCPDGAYGSREWTRSQGLPSYPRLCTSECSVMLFEIVE